MTHLSKSYMLKSDLLIKNEKNISLTISMQFDSFIARGQVRENKNLVFFPPLKERKKKCQTHKARVKQAAQATSQSKLSLHLLSANTHKKNLINKL